MTSDKTVQVPICGPTFKIGILSFRKFPFPELSLPLRRRRLSLRGSISQHWLRLGRCPVSAPCPVIAFLSSLGQHPNYRSQGRKCSCRGVPVYGTTVHPFIKNHCYSNMSPSVLPVLYFFFRKERLVGRDYLCHWHVVLH